MHNLSIAVLALAQRWCSAGVMQQYELEKGKHSEKSRKRGKRSKKYKKNPKRPVLRFAGLKIFNALLIPWDFENSSDTSQPIEFT